MDMPMSLTELIGSLSRILEIELFSGDKRMINQIKNLKQFFNNEHGENFTFNDIRQYFEERRCMIQDIISKKSQENEHFFQDDYHKLNYIIVCIKNDYRDNKMKVEEQKQREFQEKIINPAMSGMSDDEFLAMIQDTSDNTATFDRETLASESIINDMCDNTMEQESQDADLSYENNKMLDVEIVKKEMSEEFKEQISKMETRLSNKLSGIETLLSLDEEQSTVYEPKRRGRPRKNEKLMKCLCCGGDKRADETKKGIENDFYKSRSKIHLGCNGFIPICKDCLENLYDNLESELTAAIKKAGIEVAEYYIERKVIERLCMMNEIYYSDSLFDAALKHSSNNTMVSAYMKIANLIQYKKKTYEDSFKERMKEEILGMKQEQEVDLSWMEDVV